MDLESLTPYTVYPLLIPPSTLRGTLAYIKKRMAQHPHLLYQMTQIKIYGVTMSYSK